MDIVLPWPPSMFTGNTRRDWYVIAPVVKKHREWARLATAALGNITVPASGDIRVIAAFYPPHRRGDRVSYPSLLKPYWDGIADALKVNDSRFLPSYVFAEPVKDARIVVTLA